MKAIIIGTTDYAHCKNILIVKLSYLGDIIHALPFLAELRKLYPSARISWIVYKELRGFLPEGDMLDEVLYFDKGSFLEKSFCRKLHYLWLIKRELQSKNYDLVIDLQGLFKSAFLVYLTAAPYRIGTANLREGSWLVSKPIRGVHANGHMIERHLDVARFLGAEVEKIDFPLPAFTVEAARMKTLLAEQGIAEGSYVIFAPGTRWRTKDWPVGHYAVLAEKITAAGTPIVLIGGPKEAAAGMVIKKGAGAKRCVIDLCGQTTLPAMVELIRHCRLFISADTGPLHFAGALGKPLIALFGPTKPEKTGPYGSNIMTVIKAPVNCTGCMRRHCFKDNCMAQISPETVYEEYLRLITVTKAI